MDDHLGCFCACISKCFVKYSLSVCSWVRAHIAQWFIDILFITHDSRMSNKLCGRKTTKQNDFTLWNHSWLLSFCLTSCVVELGLTGLTSTSRSIRTTCSKSLALLRSSVSVLSVRPRILWSWVRKSRGSSLSRLVRATCTKSLAANLRTVIAYERLFSHPWSWTRAHRTAKLRTVKFCFPGYPHDSFRVPYGVPVQRSISEYDVSHPSCLI